VPIRPEIDLTFEDFEGADLERANLEETTLTNANLKNTILRRANLRRANLRGARLEGAILDSAYLEDARLVGAHLEGAHLWNAILYRADLSGAHLEGARLTGALLENAILRNAHLQGADFGADPNYEWAGARLRHADLRGANLTGANLEGADLTDADLSGAILDGAIMPDGKVYARRAANPGYPETEEERELRHIRDRSWRHEHQDAPEYRALVNANSQRELALLADQFGTKLHTAALPTQREKVRLEEERRGYFHPAKVNAPLKSASAKSAPGYMDYDEDLEERLFDAQLWQREHGQSPEGRAVANANSQRELGLVADQFNRKIPWYVMVSRRREIDRENSSRGLFAPARRRTPNPGQPPAWGPHHDSYYAHPSVRDHVALRITPAGREHLKNSQGPSFHLTVLERLCEVPSLPQFVLEGELGETVGGEFGERSPSGAMVHSLCEEGLIEAFIEDRPPRPQYVEPYEYNYYDNDLEYQHREMLRRRNPGHRHHRRGYGR
jgi:uncharacterized protein YjbI with pentapeptide repeats